VAAFSRPNLTDELTLGIWTLDVNGNYTNDVWAAHDTNGRAGVIKTARGKRTPWPQRFAHEVETIEALQDLPGVLRLLDRDPATPPTWMATEKAETLQQHLGDQPELGSVVALFADIADTLTEAAARGVAHRDIKPDNLFYARGRAVVGDFGLATGHDQVGLTGHGDRVGPANFCAPEALEANDTIDWFAADVFAFAKTLWVAAAGNTYPPQGPLLIRRSEADLSPYAGRASEDLARLLEIATLDNPRHRPNMTDLRDELRTWLQLHPAGTTQRPTGPQFRTAYSEFLSTRAIDAGGTPKIVDHAVDQLLHHCQEAGPSHGNVSSDPAADIDPQWGRLAHGDPDWAPEHVTIKKLSWEGVGAVRLVAVAVLDAPDDLFYDLSWQTRTSGTTTWTITWRSDNLVRMRLPSDIAEQARLADQALRHIPSELAHTYSKVGAETAEQVRRVFNDIRRREATRTDDMNEARARVGTRLAAAAAARTDLARFWAEFVAYLNTIADVDMELTASNLDNTWFCTIGDRRIVASISEPGTDLGPAVVLGTITVETESPNPHKSQVANLCAITDDSGDPVWQIVRFDRNDMGSPPARVAESLYDGSGAVNLTDLERLLDDTAPFTNRPSATLASRTPLDVDILLAVVGAELAAIDNHHPNA
jgi:serine/threonine protein kinase